MAELVSASNEGSWAPAVARPRRLRGGRVLLYAVLALFALYYLAPLYVMVATSLKSPEELREASIFVLPTVGPPSLPIFGYGMMVLIGFVSGLWLSRIRARRIGLDPEIFSDISFWLLLSGSVQEKMRKEIETKRKTEFYSLGQHVLERVAIDLKRFPDAPKPNAEKWKENAMENLRIQHQNDYDNGFFRVRNMHTGTLILPV